jgi:hypothetical protein
VLECKNGRLYNQSCSIICTGQYGLAKITDKSSPFAKKFSSADFNAVTQKQNCVLSSSSSSSSAGVGWDAATDVGQYYCRRVNDPPSDIKLSGSIINEHVPAGSVIGKITASDQQLNTVFSFTVEQSNLFSVDGDLLKTKFVPKYKKGSSTNFYSTTIRATDNGSPPMYIEKTFKLVVVDLNDPPRGIELSSTTIASSNKKGDVVGKLTAIDDDAKGNPGKPSSDFDWKLIGEDNFLAVWTWTILMNFQATCSFLDSICNMYITFIVLHYRDIQNLITLT